MACWPAAETKDWDKSPSLDSGVRVMPEGTPATPLAANTVNADFVREYVLDWSLAIRQVGLTRSRWAGAVATSAAPHCRVPGPCWGQFCDAGGTGHDDCFGHARLPICSFIATIRVIGAGPASDRCALGPGGLPMPEPIRLRRERSHPRDPRPTPWLNSRTPQSRAEVPSLSDSPGTGRTRRACPRPVHPRARARTPGCRLGNPQTRTRSFQAEDSRTNWKGRPR